MDEYKNIEEKMKKTVSVLKDELNTVRREGQMRQYWTG